MDDGVYQIVYMDEKVEVRDIKVISDAYGHVAWLVDINTSEVINWGNIRTMRKSD